MGRSRRGSRSGSNGGSRVDQEAGPLAGPAVCQGGRSRGGFKGRYIYKKEAEVGGQVAESLRG